MIIQGSHLNSMFMHPGKSAQNGALFAMGGNGPKTLAQSPAAKLTVDSKALSPASHGPMQDRVDAFGNILDSYLKGFTGKNGEEKDSSKLVNSLENTIRWVEEKYGKDAANAAMGMVMQSAASGQGESAIGQGLLNTLKMIDRNFGTTAGDAAIAQFNDGVNRQLNNFFDNGSNEVFHASESGTSGTGSAEKTATVLTKIETPTEETPAEAPLETLLDSLKKKAAEAVEAQNLAQELEEKNAPKSLMNKALLAYTTPAPQAGSAFSSII